MNPEEVNINNINAQDPKLVKRKTFRYVSIPLLHDEERINILLKDQKFRIFRSEYNGEKTYCAGVIMEGKSKELIGKLQKKIRELAMENEKEVKALYNVGTAFYEHEFNLWRMNLKTKTCSIYPKLYLSEGKATSPFFQLIEKNGRLLKKKVNPLDLLGVPLEGDIVISISQIFCGRTRSITCFVREALIKNEAKIPSVFDNYADDDEEEEEY